jgi:hypothetical protein
VTVRASSFYKHIRCGRLGLASASNLSFLCRMMKRFGGMRDPPRLYWN